MPGSCCFIIIIKSFWSCLLIQKYFCAVYDYAGKADISKGYRSESTKKIGGYNYTFFYTECPQGRPCLGLGWVSFFFFFVVVTNRQINLCIEICPPLVGMYCSDCLQQKQANQNLLLGHIS